MFSMNGWPTETGGWNLPSGGPSKLEEALAQDARLQPTHLQLLTVGQDSDVCPARHRADLCDQIHVGQRAAAEPDEARRIEPPFEILQSIRDRVPVPLHGR